MGKECADGLYMNAWDMEASMEYYNIAIDKLVDIKPAELGSVLLKQDNEFVLGSVKDADVKTKKAFVALEQPNSDQPKLVGAPLQTLVPVHEKRLALQGSLYLNRALIWMNIERIQEAADDLSTVISLWNLCESDPAKDEQLAKAHCLRAYIRFFEAKVEVAKADVNVALSS